MDRGYWGGASSCPGHSWSIDLFALPQGPLGISSPERSSLPGRPGVRPPGLHRLDFTDTAICSCPPKGYETGSGELPPKGLPTGPPPELALRHGLVP
jgi:hypothetical protein